MNVMGDFWGLATRGNHRNANEKTIVTSFSSYLPQQTLEKNAKVIAFLGRQATNMRKYGIHFGFFSTDFGSD